MLKQLLMLKNASRIPVLIVASAYEAAQDKTGEKVLSLHPHNAADSQTGALEDVEIIMENDFNVVTSYEMKMKKVIISDIKHALEKLHRADVKIDNYIFITTEEIDDEVRDYAKSLYAETGIEIAVLDCIGFIRHFLHFFFRVRTDYINAFQDLLLAEPESAVSSELKEVFLSLRQHMESN